MSEVPIVCIGGPNDGEYILGLEEEHRIFTAKANKGDGPHLFEKASYVQHRLSTEDMEFPFFLWEGMTLNEGFALLVDNYKRINERPTNTDRRYGRFDFPALAGGGARSD